MDNKTKNASLLSASELNKTAANLCVKIVKILQEQDPQEQILNATKTHNCTKNPNRLLDKLIMEYFVEMGYENSVTMLSMEASMDCENLNKRETLFFESDGDEGEGDNQILLQILQKEILK